MAAKTFSTYLSELSEVTSLGTGDRIPVLESSETKYVDGADIGGGGGITALTGDVTASGSGSVAATIAAGAVTNAKVATGIDAAKIADGTVSNAEFQYLGGVTSDIQTQLNAKQASDADITTIAGLTPTNDDVMQYKAGAWANRTIAQLKTDLSLSGTNTGDQDLSGLQPLDATLTALAGLTIAANSLTIGTGADAFSQTSFAANTFPARASTGDLEAKTITDFGLSLVNDADAATARTTLNVDVAGTDNSTPVTLAGSLDYLTITGQQITRNAIDLTTDVTGTLPIANGGTGLASLGSASQQLRVNAGGTALEYFTPEAVGDINNGGNTTGAAVTIGTNDAFGLNLETAGVTRMAITGGASTGGAVTITNVTANTNTVQDVLTLQTNSTGTAAANFGGAILFQGESSTTDNRDMVRLSAIWTTATDASRASALVYSDVTAGGALTERFRFTPATMTTATGFTIGNSGQALVIGGGSGSVTISSTGNSNITLSNTINNATSTNGVIIGAATTFTQTSGTRDYVNYNSGFAPTSGTAVHNQFAFSGTFNQTGGANGITRGIYLNQTLTAVADFRAIEIAANSSSAKGIYQTGSSTTNNFVGATNFGSTSAPNGAAIAEFTSTTKGVLLPRMTTAERDAIGSPVAGLLIYNTSTNKLNVYTTAWEAVTSA